MPLGLVKVPMLVESPLMAVMSNWNPPAAGVTRLLCRPENAALTAPESIPDAVNVPIEKNSVPSPPASMTGPASPVHTADDRSWQAPVVPPVMMQRSGNSQFGPLAMSQVAPL